MIGGGALFHLFSREFKTFPLFGIEHIDDDLV